MTAVRELFDLPESIHRIGFVQVLSEAIEKPQATADTYVVTPRLLEAFDKALKLAGNALATGRSQASYLHGSFGSGKSHFMALLSLMLSENEAVWRMPELHELRAKHKFVGKKKLLQLHFHMVGSESLEQAIFTKYIDFVRVHHPSADIPSVFADEELFEDARGMLQEFGEEAFFAPMNAGLKDEEEWGDLAVKRWTAARFDAIAQSTDPEERGKLFSALVTTRFSAFAQESRKYIDLDSGLGVIGRHAKSLGYEGIVLFLDELILWLASRASDVAWFHSEVQKMVKLVEAQESDRAIPFVSYIARQRDLAEMVGEDYAGAENARVRDSLKWSEGRYETIRLVDRDLPAIAEKRVLKLKDPVSGKKALDDAFERMRKAAGPSWQTLLGQLDATDFRRLYPFSPALVEALVALSNSLQRERTAIKLLTEILVEHADDLEMGSIVGVGDLFDVLAGGDDTADGVMKSRFESAKQLYNYQFLPIIQRTHGTDTAEKCPRLRPDHPARIGCSNCTNRACRTDNRLVKTLLISALVPEVPAIKDMTASRLVQLNHGSLKVPIPGTEANLATQKLKKWASEIAQLEVGNQSDPTVRVLLEGVEIKPIMEQAAKADNGGARQRVLRDLLFETMGMEHIAEWGRNHAVEWRATKRTGHIKFGNVRKMGPDQLRCPDDDDWRLVVDYPFDDPGFGPSHDEEVLHTFMESGEGSWTLVWLPHFFSEPINKMLGDVVILEHILDASNKREYVSHLSVENQNRALHDLTNLHTSKKSRLRQVLEKAYGLAKVTEDDGDLDHALRPEKHLVMLKPGAQIIPNIAANLADALESYVPAVLEARYPRHPKFTKKLTKNRVEELVRKFGEIIDAEDKKIPADKTLIEEVRGTLAELGLVRVTETAVHLMEERTLQELENRRNQKGSDRPEVSEIRRWIDESKKMGLETEALDLVVRCYSRWSARTFVDADRPYEVAAGKALPEHVVLERPDLPSVTQWSAALATAGATLGVSLVGKALHADNLKRFESSVREKLVKSAGDCRKLPGLLGDWASAFELDPNADRIKTATSADQLAASLDGKSGKEMVETLAAHQPKTSAKAVGISIGSAAEVAGILGDSIVLGVFVQLRTQAIAFAGAEEVLEQAAQALRQDEVNVKLQPRLKQLAKQAQELMRPPLPALELISRAHLAAKGRSEILSALKKAVEQIETAARDADDLELAGTIELRGKKR